MRQEVGSALACLDQEALVAVLWLTLALALPAAVKAVRKHG